MRTFRVVWRFAAVLAMAATLLTALPRTAFAAATPIKIGFLTSLTGADSADYVGAPLGAKAYFNVINKNGGFDGHPIQLITEDDGSSPTGAVTAINLLISDGVTAIITDSSFFFAGDKAAQQAGVPVVGASIDGDEWGQQPFTNMFTFTGSSTPNSVSLWLSLGLAALVKYLGAKDVGALSYGGLPAASSSIEYLKIGLQSDGIKMGYVNETLPLATLAVGPAVLGLERASGIHTFVCGCSGPTAVAVMTQLRQAGVNLTAISEDSPNASLLAQPSVTSALQGVYFFSETVPFDVHNPAATLFENRLKAADPSYTIGSYPESGIISAYLAADLVYSGLQNAGSNPTRHSLIAGLTKLKSWNAQGLWPYTDTFNTFGHSEKQYCLYFVRLQGQKFVAVHNGKPLCINTPASLR